MTRTGRAVPSSSVGQRKKKDIFPFAEGRGWSRDLSPAVQRGKKNEGGGSLKHEKKGRTKAS